MSDSTTTAPPANTGSIPADLAERIRREAARAHTDLVAWRRHLHAHPELSFQERETAAYVAKTLRGFGVEVQEGVADTGVVGIIDGALPLPEGATRDACCTALRADMDALPIVEANEVPYRSQNEGVMHACGHDVHTASLLGAAHILQGMRDRFAGTVKLIFQPGEERFPGGASLMIRDGVLENPAPSSVLGQHVHPPLEAGCVGFRPGPYMASADELYFRVIGQGGHAAHPHLLVDPVLMSSHLILQLQRVVARLKRPDQPAVLSIGRVIAEGATNVVPNLVTMDGTFRSFDPELRKKAHEAIRAACRGTAESFGGHIEVDIKVGYPSLYNNEALTARLRAWAGEYLGPDKVVDLEISMGAEDFAYYSQAGEACFWRLGTGNAERGITSPIHTPTFDIDESALKTGAGLMAWFALRELEAKCAAVSN
jgi:amidohydrolase